MLNILIQIVVVLLINAGSIFLFFKDKGMNELKENGTKVGNQKAMIINSAIFGTLCIVAVVIFSLFFKENTLLFNIKRLALLSMMWPLAYIDYKTFRIPNRFIVYGLAIRLVILVFEIIFERQLVLSTIITEVIAAVALAIATLLCSICVKNSIGYGDIKLFIVMGLMQGLSGVWSSVFVSLIIIFIYSVIMLIAKKKKKNDLLPFAPAIVSGTFISVILTGM